MTLQHFNTLSQHKQHRQIIASGVYIADRFMDDYHALLFDINGFYTEVCFSKDADEVLWVKSFGSTDELQPYLKNIDIRGLFR
jgi:hypothetical protein